MRLLFNVFFLAIAVHPRGLHAEPSDIMTRPSATNRHLRDLKLVQNNEEDRGDLVTFDLVRKFILEEASTAETIALLEAASSALELKPGNKRSASKSESESQPSSQRLKTSHEDVEHQGRIDKETNAPLKALVEDDPILKLDDKTDIVQVKGILDRYETAVDTFNKENSDQPTTLLRVLKAKYGDEDINKIIEIAKTDEATLPTALILESDKKLIEMQGTRSKYELLKLEGIMEWIEQNVDKFNKDYPAKEKTLLDRLGYSDNDYVEMVFRGIKIPLNSSSRKRVFDDLKIKWREARRDPKDIFARLGLRADKDPGFRVDKNIDFSGARFTYWVRYVDDFIKQSSQHEESYMSILVSELEESTLMEMLQASVDSKDLKGLRFYNRRESKDPRKLKDYKALERVKRVAFDFQAYRGIQSRDGNFKVGKELKFLITSMDGIETESTRSLLGTTNESKKQI